MPAKSEYSLDERTSVAIGYNLAKQILVMLADTGLPIEEMDEQQIMIISSIDVALKGLNMSQPVIASIIGNEAFDYAEKIQEDLIVSVLHTLRTAKGKAHG